MPIYNGKNAYVDDVPCVQTWSASLATTHQRHSSSCIAGATNSPPGIKNWSGQITGLGDFPSIVIPSLSPLTFLGVINNTGGSLKSLNGSVFIESLTIDINKATYAPISWTATFGAHGDLVEAATGAADSVVSEAPNGKDLAITIVATPITQAIQTAQLVFRRPSTTYVDAGLTYRTPGNLEADINFAVLESALEVAAYAPNALSLVKIFTTATKYWEFSKIRFGGKSNFVVDRTSNNVLGYTVNGMWNAIEGTTEGWIAFFNGSTYETAIYGTAP